MLYQALLVPGFGGSAQQPLLQKLARALGERAYAALPITLPKGRPSPDLAAETAALNTLWGEHTNHRGALIGRSFGARVAVRLATQHNVPALVLLGYPIRPPGKRRQADEQALRRLSCPTLILQGENDELGAPEVLSGFCSTTTTLEVVPKAKHAYLAAAERLVIARTVEWLIRQQRAPQ